MVEVNYDSNALIIWGIMLFIAGIFKITYPNKFTDRFIKSNLNADLLSSIIFGVLLIIRATITGARLAFFDGVLTLMLGFLIYGIEKFIEENVSNRIWGMAFYIPLLLIYSHLVAMVFVFDIAFLHLILCHLNLDHLSL